MQHLGGGGVLVSVSLDSLVSTNESNETDTNTVRAVKSTD